MGDIRERMQRERELLNLSNDHRVTQSEREEAYRELRELHAADPEIAAADAAAAADQEVRDAEMTRLFEAAALAKTEE